jgi:hypothetical protein
MLDNELIKSGTTHTLHVLNNLSNLQNSVTVVKNFFNQAMLDQLLEFCETTKNWKDAYDTVGGVINYRKKISWETDNIVEVSHTVLENVTPQISKMFNKDLKFNGIDLWKDSTGYNIARHTDNPEFNASLQVYIKNLPYLSTVFEHNGITVTDTSPGSGYLADNTVGIPHWLDGVVPENYNRFSLHATWT